MIVLVTVYAMLRADLDPAKMLLSSPPPAAAVTDTAAASVLPGPAQPRWTHCLKVSVTHSGVTRHENRK